jgi:hypothetical protein
MTKDEIKLLDEIAISVMHNLFNKRNIESSTDFDFYSIAEQSYDIAYKMINTRKEYLE